MITFVLISWYFVLRLRITQIIILCSSSFLSCQSIRLWRCWLYDLKQKDANYDVISTLDLGLLLGMAGFLVFVVGTFVCEAPYTLVWLMVPSFFVLPSEIAAPCSLSQWPLIQAYENISWQTSSAKSVINNLLCQWFQSYRCFCGCSPEFALSHRVFLLYLQHPGCYYLLIQLFPPFLNLTNSLFAFSSIKREDITSGDVGFCGISLWLFALFSCCLRFHPSLHFEMLNFIY